MSDWWKYLGPLPLLAGAAGLKGKSIERALFGRKPQVQQASLLTPEQQGMQSNLLSLGLQGLQNPYRGFEPIAQRAMSTFQQQIVPTLAERFTSLGGGLSSPAFASQLGQAGSGLSEMLAALQSQYGQQQQGLSQNLLGLGMRPSFENLVTPGSSGLFGALAPSFGQAAGQAGGMSLLKYLGYL